MSKYKKNTAAFVSELILPTVSGLGYILWYVEYVKEGADYYLRVTIDTEKDGGISIQDCEKVHRAIDPLLDEADPIENSYHLEVSSPGIERDLRLPEHFKACIGEDVEVRLYKAVDGKKRVTGKLISYNEDDGVIKLSDDSGVEIAINRTDASRVKTIFDFSSI